MASTLGAETVRVAKTQHAVASREPVLERKIARRTPMGELRGEPLFEDSWNWPKGRLLHLVRRSSWPARL